MPSRHEGPRERDLAFRKHSAVHAAFGRHFAKPGLLDPKYHGWLLTAFDTRLQGDYEVSPDVSADDVRTGLERAGEFLEAARSFLASQ